MMYAGSKNSLVQTAELTKVERGPSSGGASQLWGLRGVGSQGLNPWGWGQVLGSRLLGLREQGLVLGLKEQRWSWAPGFEGGGLGSGLLSLRGQEASLDHNETSLYPGV